MDNNQNPQVAPVARDFTAGRNPMPGAGIGMALVHSPFGFLLVIPAAIYYRARYNKRVAQSETFRQESHPNLTAEQKQELVFGFLAGSWNLTSKKARRLVAEFNPATTAFNSLLNALDRL